MLLSIFLRLNLQRRNSFDSDKKSRGSPGHDEATLISRIMKYSIVKT